MTILLDESKSGMGLGEPAATQISPRHVEISRGPYIALKLVAEWCAALLILVVSAPLILLLAVIIRISSSGPIFYAQTRLGLGGRQFRIFKLRTMLETAEQNGPVWASKGDRRVTAIGRILRLSHLDELPQLWNVLRGEMSLIGPRPERPEIAADITAMIPNFTDRLAVRPGITGLAQLLLPADDPDDTGFHCVRRKLDYDLRYIDRIGLRLDFWIALGTPCYFLAVAANAIPQIALLPYTRLASASSEQRDASRQDERCAAGSGCDQAA